MDPLSAILNIISVGIDKIFPDKDKAEAAKLEMFKLGQQGQLQEAMNTFQLATEQIRVNVEEAKSQSVFVAGWRPFIGWVCGVALAYNYVAMPFIVWGARWISDKAPGMPALDMGELSTLLFGMLGLGVMRTVEKVKSNKGGV